MTFKITSDNELNTVSFACWSIIICVFGRVNICPLGRKLTFKYYKLYRDTCLYSIFMFIVLNAVKNVAISVTCNSTVAKFLVRLNDDADVCIVMK